MSESSTHDHGHGGNPPLPRQLLDAQKTAGLVGVVGLGLLLIGLIQPEHFFRSLLYGFDFWLAVSLGCLGFVMISHLTGGAWGAIIRRFGEAGFGNLPLLLLVFLFLIPGYSKLFPWGHPDDFNPSLHRNEGPDHKDYAQELQSAYNVIQHRDPLFNGTAFTLRTLGYFAIWIALATLLRSGSVRLERGPDLVLRRKMRKVSAAGMVLFFITTTGYALDYISGRETNWYSSILGFITAISIGTAGVSFMSMMVCYFADKKPLKDVLIPQHTNDIGNILLALTILWMYTTFAQFLIQWNGNMPEDIAYYTNRGLGVVRNGWQWIALLLLLGNFFVPFFLLLQKPLKRNPATFFRIAALLFVMRMIHGLWLYAPSGPHRSNPWMKYASNGHIYWTDVAAWCGIGGIWFYNFVRMLGSQPLLARNIADEPEIIGHGTPAHA